MMLDERRPLQVKSKVSAQELSHHERVGLTVLLYFVRILLPYLCKRGHFWFLSTS
jgi:hypothetical protein